MTVWGKVTGVAAGLIMGGPLGGLVGAIAGHFLFDREGDPGAQQAISARDMLGPEWPDKVKSGVHTCL